MKKSTKSYLETTNLVKYIEREYEFFLCNAFSTVYEVLLKDTCRYGFTHNVVFYKKGVVTWYRSKSELENADKYFGELIKSNDKRIDLWFEKEEETHKIINAIKTDDDINEIIRKFRQILLYNTVIPFRFASALRFTEDEKIKKKTDQIRSKSIYYDFMDKIIRALFLKIASKYNLDIKVIKLLTVDEFIEVVKGRLNINPQEILKREDGCYIIYKKGKSIVDLSEEDILDKTDKNADLVKGEIAYKGKVKGIIKIISNPDYNDKINHGEILVSINTNPSLMPAVEKAAGIITNEGGALCHAAIIARELKKPCITGTKIATKVFKDGDLVELDAEKGIVKKIK